MCSHSVRTIHLTQNIVSQKGPGVEFVDVCLCCSINMVRVSQPQYGSEMKGATFLGVYAEDSGTKNKYH